MKTIEERLNLIESKIGEEDFLQNKGCANEVGYYIFDYQPQDELLIRNHIKTLKEKINKSNLSYKIIQFDLYDIVIDILNSKGYLEKCFDFEKNKGIEFMFNAIINTLRLSKNDNLIVNYIVENTPENCVVFITGVGKCFPIVRSHNVLNNLHQVLDTVPVVMFFPGVYSGHDLQLFGTIKDDNYYRAFRLI